MLADFGIALLADITRVTLTGAVIGTAAYMAPEQVRGELVGPPADVYALGLVLLEALTGHREYPGTGVESACARLHRASAVPETLPAGLTHTLRRMTAIEPAERRVPSRQRACCRQRRPSSTAARPPCAPFLSLNLWMNPPNRLGRRGGGGSYSLARPRALHSRPDCSV